MRPCGLRPSFDTPAAALRAAIRDIGNDEKDNTHLIPEATQNRRLPLCLEKITFLFMMNGNRHALAVGMPAQPPRTVPYLPASAVAAAAESF
jgi:hypothetical protein